MADAFLSHLLEIPPKASRIHRNIYYAWVQRTLGEVAEFSKGSGYSKGDLTETGSPIILYGRLYTNYETVIDSVDTFVDMRDNSVISQGDEVIVPSSGETAKDIARASAVATSGIILGGDLNIVKTNATINPVFLAITISNGNQQKKLSKKAQGKSVVHLRNSDLQEVVLQLPDIEEQTAIGSLFRTLDDTITLHKRKLDRLKELKRGYLQQMFPQNGETVPRVRFSGFSRDWTGCKIGDIATVKMCRRIFNEETSLMGDVPFYKIGTFGGKPDAYITQEQFDKYKSKYPYPEMGDVLISTAGTIGRIVVYRGAEEYFQDSNIVWLKINKSKLTNVFLEQFYTIVSWNGLEGSTIKRLYNSNILETAISLPSIEEQTTIGTFFRSLDDQIAAQATKSEQLKQLKSAYLQKMFV